MTSRAVHASLLTVQSAKRLPGTRHVLADVRVSERVQRVVLDFSRLDIGLVGYVELPRPLSEFHPATRVIADVLARVDRDEAVSFPLDLSEELRAEAKGEPIPWDGRAE
jgi:hypothetical protein